MKEYTKSQRALIHRTLLKAVPMLWDGVHKRDWSAVDYSFRMLPAEFICHALPVVRGHKLARGMIEDRISPYFTAQHWLQDQLGTHYLKRKDVQQWRHRWLQSLIEEFSS